MPSPSGWGVLSNANMCYVVTDSSSTVLYGRTTQQTEQKGGTP